MRRPNPPAYAVKVKPSSSPLDGRRGNLLDRARGMRIAVLAAALGWLAIIAAAAALINWASDTLAPIITGGHP